MDNQFRIAYTQDPAQIIPLWEASFGDSPEEIAFFICNVQQARCLVGYCGDKPVSMMYLVDCMIESKSYHYVYAACTDKEYEGRGYMTSLLDYCFSQGLCLCLIPGNDALIDFYAKRGLKKRVPIASLTFNQTSEILEYLLDGFELTEPTALCNGE